MEFNWRRINASYRLVGWILLAGMGIAWVVCALGMGLIYIQDYLGIRKMDPKLGPANFQAFVVASEMFLMVVIIFVLTRFLNDGTKGR